MENTEFFKDSEGQIIGIRYTFMFAKPITREVSNSHGCQLGEAVFDFDKSVKEFNQVLSD